MRDAHGTMLTPDFVWHTPRGTAELLNGGRADFHGDEAFSQLAAVGRAAYATFPEPELVFCIAEDDWVVMQLNVHTVTHDGAVYANTYAMTFRCEEGRIAELWEHADTKHWWDVVVGRPEQHKNFVERLAAERENTD
jgi:ketosteroid isomerase-like protein